MSLIDRLPRERPRERLLRLGADALSDTELLGVFFGTGTSERDAVELAEDCLSTFGGLAALLNAPRARFCSIDGLGPARYARLHAIVEIVRRSFREGMAERSIFDSPASVRDYLRLSMGSRPHEVFCVLLIDVTNNWVKSGHEQIGLFLHTVFEREADTWQ